MHKLVIQDDEGKTTVVPLIRDEITVGRKEGNTIRLTERNVSRKHARILRKNGTITIEDLNSYNGVRVNGTRIQGRIGLNVSDRIQIGDYLIELKADTAPHAAYDDQKTQPIDKIDPLASSPGIPVPHEALGGPDAETTKMPAALMIPGMPPMGHGVDAMAETDPAMAMRSAEHAPEGAFARMVILSTNYAGREFHLNKPAMVIGRTDDNDLVINHRSISRHHAKVVRENGRYAIVDLQSSNGVRVNGEEYGKVELRRGDIIDLGHVRLRFVEPGEDFVFGRDAHAIPLPSGGSRGLFFGLVAAVVIVGVIGAVALTRGGDDDDPGDPNPATARHRADGGAEHRQIVAPVATDAAAAPQPRQPGDADKVQPLLQKAREAIKQERWAEAVDAANQALAIDPEGQDARELLAKAQRENENKAHFAEFKQAVKRRDARAVSSKFDAIAEDSVYRDRARDDYNRVGEQFKAAKLAEARRLAKASKCRELRALREEAAAVWPPIDEPMATIEASCKTPAVASGTTSRKPSNQDGNSGNESASESGTRQGSGGDEGDGDKPDKSYDQLLRDARQAAKDGQYGKAKRHCDDALKLKPRDAEALTLCGIAACYLKQGKVAKRYQSQLSSTERKSYIRQFCLKNGVKDFE